MARAKAAAAMLWWRQWRRTAAAGGGVVVLNGYDEAKREVTAVMEAEVGR